MRRLRLALTFVSLAVGSAVYAQADKLQIGSLAMGGAGCVALHDAALVSDSSILLPVETHLEKDPNKNLNRSACSLALPVAIAADQKLVVDSANAILDTDLSRGSALRAKVSIFTPGRLGKSDEISLKAKRSAKGISADIDVAGPVIETACGEATNLRANMSLTLQGGDVNTVADISSVELIYHLEPCGSP